MKGGLPKGEPAREYDIAFSLRAPQLATARALARALRPDFTSFIWAERQKSLVGSGVNGVDAFKHIFRRDAALNVILLSDGWGKTPWTRHEEDAIRDRMHQSGWESLLVIRAERDAVVPDWIGETRLHFDLVKYGRAEAAGAIRYRMTQLAVASRRQSAAELLAERNGEQERLSRQAAHFQTRAAYAEVEAEVERFIDELDRLGAELVDKEPGICVGRLPGRWAVVGHRRGSALDWETRYRDSIRDAALTWSEFNGMLFIQTGQISRSHTAHPVERRSYLPVQDETDAWIWQSTGRGRATYTSEQLAEKLVHRAVENFFSNRQPPPPQREGHGWVSFDSLG